MSQRIAPQPAADDSGAAAPRGPLVRVRGAAPAGDAYRAFGNVETRNGLQERLEIPTMLSALNVPHGGRVLEVGCGRGVALPVLARRLQPATLSGLDIDAELVERARERVASTGVRAIVVEGDLRSLPFDDGTFDLVIDFGTCYHVGGGRSGAASALSEVARVLRTGGRFVHETPIAQHLAHPVRSFGRTLPWRSVRSLVWERSAVLWSVRRKVRSDR